jgi:hypothetical protein
MSTRANIFIRNNYDDYDKEILYHHCDGYPEGVGRDLRIILQKFAEEYPDVTLTKRLIADYICKSDEQFEITTPNRAADAEYNYEINLEKRRVDYEHVYTSHVEWLCDF